MVERTVNMNNISSHEDENDRPSTLTLSCCIAAFFTSALCLLLGTFIACLKIFYNSSLDEFLPLNTIIFSFLSLTALYLALGICLVFYKRGLRRRLYIVFNHILRNYLPRYSKESRYPVSPRRTAATRNRCKIDNYRFQERPNLKPKTMVDIVSQRQLDEIFKPILEDKSVGGLAWRKYHPTANLRGRYLSKNLKEATKSQPILPSNLKRDIDFTRVRKVPINTPEKQYAHKPVMKQKITSLVTKYGARNPQSSFTTRRGRGAAEPDTDYMSLELPEIEICEMNRKKSLEITRSGNQSKYGQKVTIL